jgi:hypothetical protein
MIKKTEKITTQKLRIELRAVFYKEGRNWIAHCLEMDVMGHARGKKKAFANMLDAVFTQIRFSIAHNNRSNIFMPADRRFFEMYSAGKDVAARQIVIDEIDRRFANDDIVIQPVETREYDCAMA